MDNEISEMFQVEGEGTPSSIIRVIGVGGAGCNTVNYIHGIGIKDVSFVVCNTDLQALNDSMVETKVQLGRQLTKGLGAGNNPAQGRQSALESIDDINAVLEGAEMVFVTAGMGGGTGTGAAPVIAKAAKEKGILTIGVVSIPDRNEGYTRIVNAIKGLQEMKENVDSMVVLNSERLNTVFGDDADFEEVLDKANEVLGTATKGIAELITKSSKVNLDLADVRTAMTDSGTTIVGIGTATGEGRARKAVEEALNAPLLNYNDIRGARNVLANIQTGTSNKMKSGEQKLILSLINEKCANNHSTNVMWGYGSDEQMGEEMRITIVATGFPDNTAYESQLKQALEYNFSQTGEYTMKTDENNHVDLPARNTEHDKQIDSLYNQHEKEALRSTASLADPQIFPIERLADEEIISRIEDVPAYERRSHK